MADTMTTRLSGYQIAAILAAETGAAFLLAMLVIWAFPQV